MTGDLFNCSTCSKKLCINSATMITPILDINAYKIYPPCHSFCENNFVIIKFGQVECTKKSIKEAIDFLYDHIDFENAIKLIKIKSIL